MLKFSEIFEFSKEKLRKIPILKEFEWFEWFEWLEGSNGSVPRRSSLSTRIPPRDHARGPLGRVERHERAIVRPAPAAAPRIRFRTEHVAKWFQHFLGRGTLPMQRYKETWARISAQCTTQVRLETFD